MTKYNQNMTGKKSQKFPYTRHTFFFPRSEKSVVTLFPLNLSRLNIFRKPVNIHCTLFYIVIHIVNKTFLIFSVQRNILSNWFVARYLLTCNTFVCWFHFVMSILLLSINGSQLLLYNTYIHIHILTLESHQASKIILIKCNLTSKKCALFNNFFFIKLRWKHSTASYSLEHVSSL